MKRGEDKWFVLGLIAMRDDGDDYNDFDEMMMMKRRRVWKKGGRKTRLRRRCRSMYSTSRLTRHLPTVQHNSTKTPSIQQALASQLNADDTTTIHTHREYIDRRRLHGHNSQSST